MKSQNNAEMIGEIEKLRQKIEDYQNKEAEWEQTKARLIDNLEQKKRESKEKYQIVAEYAKEGILILNDKDVVFYNLRWLEMTGYSTSEYETITLSTFVHPEDYDFVTGIYKSLFSGKKDIKGLEFRIITKSRKIKQLKARISIISWEDQPACMIFIEDITEQVKTEGKLKESEEKFSKAFFSQHIAMQIFDLNNGNRIEVNDSFIRLFGYTRKELFKENIFSLCVWVSQKAQKKAIHLLNETGYISHYPMEIINKSGEIRSLLGYATILEIEDNNLAIASYIDITDQKVAESAKSEAEKQFRDLMEQSPFAILILSPDGKIIQANEAFSRLYDIPSEFLPEIFSNYNILHDKQLEEIGILPYIQKAFSGEMVNIPAHEYESNITLTLILKKEQKRRKRWLRSKVYPIMNKKSQIQNVVLIQEDITDVKKADDKIKKYTQQLKTLNSVSATISSSLALEEVYKLILDQIQVVFPVNTSAIFLFENNQLRVAMDWGINPSFVGVIFESGDSLFNEIRTTGKPLVVDNPLSDPRFKNWGASVKINTWMGLPLFVRGDLIGIMTLDSFQANAFGPDMIPLLIQFAAQAGQAIDNARQFSTAQRRLARLTSLRNIDQAITDNLDLKETLNIILNQIVQHLEVDAATILLYQAKDKNLIYSVGQGFQTEALQHTNLDMGQDFAGQVALERRTIIIPNLKNQKTGFLRSPSFKRENFISYIGIPLLAKGKVTGVLEIFHRKKLETAPEWLEFLNTLAGQAAIAIENKILFNDLQLSNIDLLHAYDATIEGWATALELRDMETEGHSRKVVEKTILLAQEFGIPEEDLVHIRRGALLHDIGKMGVSDSILQKPGKLSDEEWLIMKQHPVFAYNWLSSIPFLNKALDIPYCHHEKWDGTGYPRGLKREEIPINARLFTIIDVYDALISDRPYRQAWPKAKVLTYIKEQSGKHFDPEIVELFLQLIRKE
ncbi:MAG: PAS domain S-box protein [Anaerolineaceae bacterium]|nr:PAS domain S-box protein [Anaerolineaceae bacterium]